MSAEATTTLTFGIRGPIAREDLPGLSRRVCELFRAQAPSEAICAVAGVEPDAVTVDALARLALVAKRYECRLRLAGASSDLRRLVTLMGLDGVF